MNSRLREIIRRDCEEAISPVVPRLEKLKDQTVYITGGTGFMGTWLVESLSFLNDYYSFNTKVLLISRNADSFKEKAPHLAERKDVTLISDDVRNITEIPDQVSYIVHAAATPDNRQHVSDPIGVMKTITKGTNAVLSSALNLPGLKKMLNISSGQIYGKQPEELKSVPENYAGGINCSSIASIYPEAKRYAETLCSAYWSLNKIPVVIARPFSFIGPYQVLDKPWAINNFVRDALLNYPIRIIGNGQPVRSYLYPSDMAIWLLLLLVEGIPGVAYNVGSPEGISLKELAETIRTLANAKSEIIVKNMNQDHSRFIPDIKSSVESLGLTIHVGIQDAITRSMEWYKKAAAD